MQLFILADYSRIGISSNKFSQFLLPSKIFGLLFTSIAIFYSKKCSVTDIYPVSFAIRFLRS